MRSAALLLLALPVLALDRDGYLTDAARAIDVTSARKLTSLLSGIEGRTGYDFAIVVVKKAEGGSQRMADALLKQWDHGNLGLVVVLAVEDGEFDFAHAPGLSKVFTPAYCAELSEKRMLPQFSDGKFGAGLVAAVEAFSDKVPAFEGPKRQVEWFRMLVAGKHVGWMGRSCETTTEKGAPAFLTKEEGMTRDASGRELRWVCEYVETHDGKPIRSKEQFLVGDKPAFEVVGEVFYDEFRAVRTEGEGKEEKTLAAGTDLLFPRGVRERVRARKAPRFRYDQFEPHTLEVVAHDVEVLGPATVEVSGAPTEGVRTKETLTPPGNVVEVVWDGAGYLLRWEDASLKTVFERCSNEQAVTLPK